MYKLKEDELVLHTPCLYTGMYPRCPKFKGKCELEGIAKQVWDKDHIIEMCLTPSIVIKRFSEKNPNEFRKKPLVIVKELGFGYNEGETY